MKTWSRIMPVLFAATCIAIGCSTAPKTQSEKDSLISEAEAALKEMKATDPGLDNFLRNAHGYVIFPSVGKGGLIAGGAYGRGAVYEQGQFVGYADLSQASLGLQAGGQTFRELLAFQSKEAFDKFRRGELTFGANASAVALKSGASSSAQYRDGVVVFTHPIGGLMFEVSISGQQFTFQPK